MDRFWSKVDKSGECWVWIGARFQNRWGKPTYGMCVVQGKVRTAHRYSWEIANGPIPPGLMVLHSCDNQRCVRPDHLSLGTHRQNMDEAVVRGSMRRGSEQHSARLTSDDVRAIRLRLASGDHQRAIASAYGVTQAAIHFINIGRTWKWLTD